MQSPLYSIFNDYFYDEKFPSDVSLVYHSPPLDKVWLSETEHCACLHIFEEHHCLAENHEQVNWIDKTPDIPSDLTFKFIEQFNTPVFVLEGGHGPAQPYNDDESIIPTNAPE